MRFRVTAGTRKALAELKHPKKGSARGGIMLVPQMLSIEEWTAIAVPMQQKLLEESRDEVNAVVTPHIGPDPADVTHRYKVRR